MAAGKRKTRARKSDARAPLTRAQVVAAAIALADREGLSALSMRALARELGVEAMSLYHHVADKEQMLDLMVDAVFALVELPEEGDWLSAMRGRARSIRSALMRHPWALGVLESRKNPGPVTLRFHDATVGRLRRAGLSIELVAHALAVIDSYVYGFVLQELSLPFSTSEEAAKIAGEILERADPGAFPRLAEMASLYVLSTDYSFASEFEYGLELVLDALSARHSRSS